MVYTKKTLPWLIILISSIILIWPLFHDGFFPMHDDTQPTRVFEMSQALKDGQFPVRWVGDLGYGFGYPIFNFYAPLPYYFGSIFIYLGLNVLIATKLMFATGILISIVSMYLLSRRLWGVLGGITSAVIYAFAPYHAVQIYVRGAVGEYWVYGLLPLILLGILETKNNFYKGIVITSISLAGVILSHNISAMIIFGLLSIWLLIEMIKLIFKSQTQQYFFPLIVTIILSLSLSAFFWLPALTEAKFTQVEKLQTGTNNYHDHFVYIDQLWNWSWGFGGSALERADGMSFKIGKLSLIIGFLVLIGLLFKSFKVKKMISCKLVIFFIGMIFSVFMMLPVSVKVWEIIPLSGYIQYPWRFLVISSFFISLICGGVFFIFNQYFSFKYAKKIIFLFMIGVIVLINYKYFQPQNYNNKTADDYISSENIKWNISKISDEYLPKYFPIPQKSNEVSKKNYSLPDGIIVNQSEFRTQFAKVRISASKDAEITFSRAYFPGWQAIIDQQKVEIQNSNGLIKLNVPEGNHLITLYFKDTNIRIYGNLVSIVGLLVLLILITKLNYINKNL